MVTGGMSRKEVLTAIVGTFKHLIVGVGAVLGLMPKLPNQWARAEGPVPQVSHS